MSPAVEPQGRRRLYLMSGSVPGPSHVNPGDPDVFPFLIEGALGQAWLLDSVSNDTFLVEVCLGERRGYGVYKPRAGEAPLWDFPSGTLYRRELAAYVVSRLLGWGLVPPTVQREGEHGIGSLQLYVPPIDGSTYFSVREDHPEEIRRMAVFDMVINNADRKAGHCFEGRSGGVWGIDHGLTFHGDPKLRTVIWDFAGEPVPKPLVDDVRRLGEQLGKAASELVAELSELVAQEEMDALRRRVDQLTAQPVFPSPYSRRSLPYPLV